MRDAFLYVHIDLSCFLAGYVGIVTREEKQEAGYSLQSFWVAFGFAINFFVSGYISATFNFTIMVCFLLVAVVFFVIGDEAQTSSTKEFFKSLCMRKNKGSDMDDPNSLLVSSARILLEI